MLRGDFMPCAHNAALETRKGRFHGVCMHGAVRILPRVIYSPMQVLLHFIERPRVDSGFVGHNHFDVAPDVSIDNLSHGCRLGILSMNKPKIAVTLSDANDYLWVILRTPTAFFTSHVGFINLI